MKKALGFLCLVPLAGATSISTSYTQAAWFSAIASDPTTINDVVTGFPATYSTCSTFPGPSKGCYPLGYFQGPTITQPGIWENTPTYGQNTLFDEVGRYTSFGSYRATQITFAPTKDIAFNISLPASEPAANEGFSVGFVSGSTAIGGAYPFGGGDPIDPNYESSAYNGFVGFSSDTPFTSIVFDGGDIGYQLMNLQMAYPPDPPAGDPPDPPSVPEPLTCALTGLGLVMVALFRR